MSCTADKIDQHAFVDLGRKVMGLNSNIGHIIRHDLKFFEKYEEYDPLDPEEKRGYKEGLYLGYQFAIGYMTLTNYFRSNADTLEEYLGSLRSNEHEMPVQNRSQRKRVKTVRVGKALIDAAVQHEFGLEDSSELSREDFGVYRFDSGSFSVMVEEMEGLIWHEKDAHVADEVVEGLSHGLENGLQMYIQSREQAILGRYEADYDSYGVARGEM